MAIPYSTRMWLGSSVLASLLLASSLTASASSETVIPSTITRSSMKSVLVASSIVPSKTYTEAVRKQMQWVSIPMIDTATMEAVATLQKSDSTPSAPATVVAQNPQPASPATPQTVKSAKAQPAKPATPPKPVQLAAVPQQVSRSDDSSLVDKALSLAGVPYVFGGSSRSGFDCSGYTQYVFKASGISLPRTSVSQFNVGSSVSRDQLQSGDLVFFTTYAAGASHVGIYIGGGNFVHASNSGVRTTSLSDSYYANRYVGARRVN